MSQTQETLDIDAKVRGMDDAAMKMREHFTVPELAVRVAALRAGEGKQLTELILDGLQTETQLANVWRDRALQAEARTKGVESAWHAAGGEGDGAPKFHG